MEILRRGLMPEETEYRAECYRCKSLIQFKRSEGKLTYDQRDGDFISVACPVCLLTITVSVSAYIKKPEGARG